MRCAGRAGAGATAARNGGHSRLGEGVAPVPRTRPGCWSFQSPQNRLRGGPLLPLSLRSRLSASHSLNRPSTFPSPAPSLSSSCPLSPNSLPETKAYPSSQTHPQGFSVKLLPITLATCHRTSLPEASAGASCHRRGGSRDPRDRVLIHGCPAPPLHPLRSQCQAIRAPPPSCLPDSDCFQGQTIGAKVPTAS